MRVLRLFSVVAALVGVLAVQTVAAQLPPTRFFGTVTIDGAPAPPGTEIRAYINDIECGFRVTEQEGLYGVDAAHSNTIEGCGFDDLDMTVTFTVNGVPANETGTFVQGTFVELNLSVGAGGAPPPADPPTDPSQPEPTPEPAPEPEPAPDAPTE